MYFLEGDFQTLKRSSGRLGRFFRQMFGGSDRGVTAAEAVARGATYDELLNAAEARAYQNSDDWRSLRAMGLFALDCVAHAAFCYRKAFSNDSWIDGVIEGIRGFVCGDAGLSVVRDVAKSIYDVEERALFEDVKMTWLLTKSLMQRVGNGTAYIAKTSEYESVLRRCFVLGARTESEALTRLDVEFGQRLDFLRNLSSPTGHHNSLTIDPPTAESITIGDWRYLSQVMQGLVYHQYSMIIQCAFPYFKASSQLTESIRQALPEPDTGSGWYHVSGPKYERGIGKYIGPMPYTRVVSNARDAFVTASTVCSPAPNVATVDDVIALEKKLNRGFKTQESICKDWEFDRLQVWLSDSQPEPFR